MKIAIINPPSNRMNSRRRIILFGSNSKRESTKNNAITKMNVMIIDASATTNPKNSKHFCTPKHLNMIIQLMV